MFELQNKLLRSVKTSLHSQQRQWFQTIPVHTERRGPAWVGTKHNSLACAPQVLEGKRGPRSTLVLSPRPAGDLGQFPAASTMFPVFRAGFQPAEQSPGAVVWVRSDDGCGAGDVHGPSWRKGHFILLVLWSFLLVPGPREAPAGSQQAQPGNGQGVSSHLACCSSSLEAAFPRRVSTKQDSDLTLKV